MKFLFIILIFFIYLYGEDKKQKKHIQGFKNSAVKELKTKEEKKKNLKEEVKKLRALMFKTEP